MKAETKVFIIGVAAVITIILGVIFGSYYRDIRMAELGYEEVTLAGKQWASWQKVKEPCK